jgi:hypothetical protein
MIIAISGKARTGKDTVANHLKEQYGFTVKHWADALYEECRQPHTIEILSHGTEAGEDCNTDPHGVRIDGREICDPALAYKVLEWWSKDLDQIKAHEFFPGEEGDALLVIPDHRMTKKDPLFLQWWGTDFRRKHDGDNYWVSRFFRGLSDLLPKKGGSQIDHWFDLPHIAIADTRFPNEADATKSSGGQLWRVETTQPWESTGRDEGHPSEIALDWWTNWNARIQNDRSKAALFRTVDAIMDYMHIRRVVAA